MDENKRIGLFIKDDLLDLCDRNVGRDESSSRSEFVCNAIEFYIAWLNKEMEGYFLSPELESVISSKIKDTENRLSRVIFKQSVEIAMLIHIISGLNHIAPDRIDGLRKMCADHVSKLGGRYRFEDIVDFQNGGDG